MGFDPFSHLPNIRTDSSKTAAEWGIGPSVTLWYHRRIFSCIKEMCVKICQYEMAASVLFFALTFSIGCSAGSKQERGAITIPNAGFEHATLSPWASFMAVKAAIVTAQSHAGKSSLMESGGKGSVYQDIRDLEGGASYTLSAWVMSSADGSTEAQLAVFDPTANVAVFSDAVRATPTWMRVKQTFRVMAPGVARIHLCRSEGNGNLYWDDVEIARGEGQ